MKVFCTTFSMCLKFGFVFFRNGIEAKATRVGEIDY